MDFGELLVREIKPTMGCTDPGTVAFAAAKAAALLKGEINEIHVKLSPNLYKNALYVSIPTIKTPGIGYAALLGALIKKPQKKLAVLGEIDEPVLKEFANLKDRLKINVAYQEFGDPLHLEVKCCSERESIQVIIQGDYDHIYRIYRDDRLIFEDAGAASKEAAPEEINLEDIFNFVMDAPLAELQELMEYEAINKQAAFHGMPVKPKVGGQATDVNINEIAGLARLYTYYASKTRMSGEPFKIISVAGSGNLGIASMLSVAGICDYLRVGPDVQVRALALSILTAIYIKNYMDRTTVMCGTAIAGGAGGSAAATYIFGGGFESVKRAVNTTIGTLTGMICDGAKESCAFKASMAAENGVINGYLALQGDFIHHENGGIITADIDQNVRNIGQINNECMNEVNQSILTIIQERH